MKEKKKTENPKKGDWKGFFNFIKEVPISWGLMLLTLLFTLASYTATSFIPGSTAAVLEEGSFEIAALAALVIYYVCNLIMSLCNGITSMFASAISVRTTRKIVWKKMMKIKSSYFDHHDSQKLLSAITNDAEVTISSIINVCVSLPSVLYFLVLCLMQVSGHNPKLLAIMFILIPVYIVYAIFMGRYQHKVGLNNQMQIGALTGFLTERIRNLPLIKAFATEKKEISKGIDASKKLYKAKMQYNYVNGIVVGYTMFTEAINYVTAVLWASILLKNGEIAREDWLTFFYFVPMIGMALRQLSMAWPQIKEVQGRAARMSELLAAPDEVFNENETTEIKNGDIIFNNILFGYNDEQILSNVSMTIPQGKTTAIVGASGSGKTTILKLLEVLYTPNEGNITIAGNDLSTLNLKAWRDKISYVAQDAAVFSGTIKEILTYGIKEEVSIEKLDEVTKLAGIYDYIMNHGGYDTKLELWGSTLSGGQRQRLVIAREILKNADILLMDEPTSALDAQTAADISNTIRERFIGKTIIIVTHELNFISDADQIIVLNQGKVSGCGNHDTLMTNCSEYKDLVDNQTCKVVLA